VFASVPAARGRVLLSAARGEVVFQDVSFRHGPSSPWLFRNLSFCVRAGEKVALVGRSGAGKSTLLQLLLGALTPTEGTITIDGVPVDELDRRGLARWLGAVLQEPFLLDDTVEHNLRLRAPDATHEALVSAAESALAHEVILALPEGYRTRLGGDVQLSGGQRQRLAIARALVSLPRVLLLDEATSSLDRATEAALHTNLGRLACTRILVAHRLATVRDADRILVLENGQLAQQGSYRELAAAPGLLRELEESAA
jgi:ABC-type multidrug transport system fused ATPase/permease subunit